MFNKTFMNEIFSKEKCGFTLAEVLITLGIVGVVEPASAAGRYILRTAK